MTPETEKRLRKWLAADWQRDVRIEVLDQMWCASYGGALRHTGHTLNAAVRRFLDAADGKRDE